MTKTFKPVILRTNGGSLILTVPVDITRNHNLKLGDSVYWISELDDPDTIKLKSLDHPMY
jgi:hypothetical protein